MKRPIWKHDWFWPVFVPEALLGAILAVALFLGCCNGRYT